MSDYSQFAQANPGTDYPVKDAQLRARLSLDTDKVDSAGLGYQFGYKRNTTVALSVGYYGGVINVAGTKTVIADGTVAVANNQTNYVERTVAGVVSANTAGYTVGKIPMFRAVTAGGMVTGVTDDRQSNVFGDLLANGIAAFKNTTGVLALRAGVGVNTAATTGAGVEIKHTSATGISEIASYDRDAASYKILSLRGSSVSIIGDTALTGEFIASGNIIASSGIIRSPDGSAAMPSLQPGVDADTGFFRPTTNTIGIATAGVEVARFDATGDLTVSHTYSNTTASAANTYVDSAGKYYRSTSSEAFKTDIEPMDAALAETLVDQAEPIWYRSLCDGDRKDWSFYGLSAEALANIDPRYVHFKRAIKTIEIDEEREVQATELRTVPRERFDIVDGQAVRVLEDIEVEVPLFDEYPVVDEAGDPVMVLVVPATETAPGVTAQLVHSVPRMVKKIVKVEQKVFDDTVPPVPDGVMYERIVAPLILQVQLLKARIAALEVK